MVNEYDVFVMDDLADILSFDRQKISNDQIPDQINGEAGFHVCYVRALTELIARHLVKITDKYELSDEQIEMIALASTLHDIGKTQIPKAILHKEDKLTPLEYDIVKKHTVLGGTLIDELGEELSPDLRKCVKDIALYHHERYDGNGYPEGLVGDEIPIAAQIVSIADAYEALTTERSYKNALSGDVALEMITNGMCGVFNPLLVESLFHVVGSKLLEDIRSSIMSSRAIYIDPYSLPPQKVLLLGNMRYITQEFIDATFPNAHVTIIGKCDIPKSPKIKVYDVQGRYFKAILETYEFDFVIYFAYELTYDTIDPSDVETLRQILKASKYISKNAKFLYLSSLDAAFEEKNDRGIVSASKEQLCAYWARENHVDIKIVRIPYLYNAASKNDYFYELFELMQKEEPVRVRESEDSRTYFLSLEDLSDLIIRIVDTWSAGDGILTINDDFDISFGDICRKLKEMKPGAVFDFTGKNAPKRLGRKNTAVKKQYSWFAKISVMTELEEQYEAFLKTMDPPKTKWVRLMDAVKGHSKVVKTAELFFMFLLTELLVWLTDSALFFSIVDFRLVFVVIMATLYGLPYGIGAAALSSVAWAIAKIVSGTNWIMLFYEPTNWLAFIFFFLVGAICGYVKLKKDDRIQFTEEENVLLESKLTFTRKIYEDTFNEKRDLKKQIIGSKDSFGKIFDITRQLNTVDARELYLKIVNCFEGILENRSLSVYSINKGSYFARLEVASRDIIGEVSRSISLNNYAPVMEKIEKGEVWRNINLLPGMPMYACGIYQNDQPILLIFLWHARMEQRSLYYVNLFRILCDLAQMSFLRAHDYNQALLDKQYLAGTRIQNAEAYEGNLQGFRDLAERKVFQYLQIEIDPKEKTIEEMDKILGKCVRANDIIGVMNDGKLRILFSQAGPDDLQFILPRFEKVGLEVTVLE